MTKRVLKSNEKRHYIAQN